MYTYIKFCFISILTFTTGFHQVLTAQQLQETEYLSQHVLNTWDNTNGLPQNTVFNTTTDSDGFLWATTEEGLVRFDGANFKIFNSSNISGIESAYFIDVESSQEGGIWAASRRDIVRVQNFNIKTLHFGAFSNAQITNITEGTDGRLWIGTNTSQLFIMEDDSLRLVKELESHISESIHKIEAGPRFIFVGTTSGLFKIDQHSEEITSIPLLEDKTIRTIFVVNDNEYWVGTINDGLFHFSEEQSRQYTTEDGFRENFITDITIDNQAQVWVSTINTGLYKFEDSAFYPISKVDVLEDGIRCIHASQNGIIWIGTTGSGLLQLKPADIYALPQNEDLSSSIVLPIYQHPNGEIWIGTAGRGVNRLSGESVTHYSQEDGLSHDIILSIYGTDDYIYVGTSQGLNRFNLNTNTFDKLYTINEGLLSNIVQAVYESSQNELFVATRAGGLHKIVDEKIQQIPLPEKLENAEFISFFEDSNKNIWIATNGVGAVKLSSKGEIEVFSKSSGLPTNVIHHFYEDIEGAIWISTARGVTVVDNDTLKSFDENNGLKVNELFFIAEDENGYLWMSSNFGLQGVESRELLKAKQSSDDDFELSTRLFTSNNGMPNSEANGGIYPAAWTMKNGEIWFPTVDGVAIVNPKALFNADSPVNIQFEALRFGGQEVYDGEDIIIPAGVNYIEVDYTSIDFLNPNDITYAYRIKELDKEWTYVNARRTIYLTLQNPGKYTLEMMASRNGLKSNIVKQKFTIQPFFYQSWWFQFSALAFLFGLGFLVNQLRNKSKRSTALKSMVDIKTKDLQEALGEKDVLLQEVHHRVKNNLAVISGLLQIQQFETSDKRLSKILGNSVSRIKSMALIHEKLYRSNSLSNLEFQPYLLELADSIKKSFDTKNYIQLHIDCDPVLLNVNQAVPCALILNEAISNSLDHAFKGPEAGTVEVNLKDFQNRVTVTIKDDGRGVPQKTLDEMKTMGLTIIKTLILQLDAELSITNTDGTEITFSFVKQDLKGSHSRMV